MATKPLTDAARERLEANAQGLDIVGLEPGQHFDPIGDMDRAIAAMPRRIRLRAVDASTEPVTYATVVTFDVAVDGTLTPHFPADTSAATRAEFEAFKSEADIRAVYTSYGSFFYWDHEGDPDPSAGNERS